MRTRSKGDFEYLDRTFQKMRSLVLFSLLAFLLLPITVLSTHLRGGQIRVIPQLNSLTCAIEITVYTNTGSEIKFGEGLLDFGDGTTHTTPTIENTKRPDIGDGFGMVTYTVVHTFPGTGTYIVSYLEPNLAGGILNMTNSVETRFYIETSIVLSDKGFVASPQFPADPIFVCQVGRPYSFSTAAIDGPSRHVFYKYSLITDPKLITDYKLPENIAIDENTGILTWDTKYGGQYVQGEIWVVVKVAMFHETGDFLGYVLRAMQVVAEDYNSTIDVTSTVDDSSGRVTVEEGKQKDIKFVLSDDNYGDNLHFDLIANDAIQDNVTFTQYDSLPPGRVFRVGKLKLKTTPGIVSDLPYLITVRGVSVYKKDITIMYLTSSNPLPQVITGVHESRSQTKLNVFPNPFQSQLYVDGKEATFLNSAGHVVMRSPIQKGSPVDTSSIPAGFYILQVVGHDGSKQTAKLIRN